MKNPEVVIRPLTVTGNVNICMDYVMFHSFTVHNMRKVAVILDEKETYKQRKMFAGTHPTDEIFLITRCLKSDERLFTKFYV